MIRFIDDDKILIWLLPTGFEINYFKSINLIATSDRQMTFGDWYRATEVELRLLFKVLFKAEIKQ